MKAIEIVSATRLTEAEFKRKSALGRSLQRLGFDGRLCASLAFANRAGLPLVFNSRIGADGGGEILVFIHDDVWIDDFYFVDRVIEGLGAFDVIGVAGNRRRVSGQPSWAHIDNGFTWDARENLSGAIAHGQGPFGDVSRFGAAPAPCELLDGVFLAARKSLLQRHRLAFDPRFDFHFYDLDFCRSARDKGLRLGTWPICLTHQSSGSFGHQHWRAMHRLYLEKWGELGSSADRNAG